MSYVILGNDSICRFFDSKKFDQINFQQKKTFPLQHLIMLDNLNMIKTSQVNVTLCVLEMSAENIDIIARRLILTAMPRSKPTF